MILTQIGGIFPTSLGYFPPKNGNLQFFSFLKLENIIQMFQTLFKGLNWKQHIIQLKYNDINTNWGIFPEINEVFFQKKGKFVIFFISQIGEHYQNVPNVIRVLKLKTAYD